MKHESIVVVYDSCQAVAEAIADKLGAETFSVQSLNNRQIENCQPDSGVRFMNYEIPKWDVIVKTCCEAAKLVDNPITGWDVAINSHGDVVFVEGNYGPDFDVMQSPLKRGVKKRITAKVKEYFDIEM